MPFLKELREDKYGFRHPIILPCRSIVRASEGKGFDEKALDRRRPARGRSSRPRRAKLVYGVDYWFRMRRR